MTKYNITVKTMDSEVNVHKNVRFEIKDNVLRIENYGAMTCYPLCNVQKYAYVEV